MKFVEVPAKLVNGTPADHSLHPCGLNLLDLRA